MDNQTIDQYSLEVSVRFLADPATPSSELQACTQRNDLLPEQNEALAGNPALPGSAILDMVRKVPFRILADNPGVAAQVLIDPDLPCQMGRELTRAKLEWDESVQRKNVPAEMVEKIWARVIQGFDSEPWPEWVWHLASGEASSSLQIWLIFAGNPHIPAEMLWCLGM